MKFVDLAKIIFIISKFLNNFFCKKEEKIDKCYIKVSTILLNIIINVFLTKMTIHKDPKDAV